MIDLGLTKLAVIGAVALIVIGPKDLPKVARMAGTLLGRAQRYISQVKSEVSREIELEELRKMQSEVETAAQNFQQSVGSELNALDKEFAHEQMIGGGHDYLYADQPLPSLSALQEKARSFRRRKVAKTSNLPQWYKSRHGQRTQVMSGSARMAKHRVKSKVTASFF
ncbi:MAG: Sec-independent protein translocase subunit TatB [Burkholderiales bacterium]|nr:Sec-independent protein translocase subunit TatB [Burkholderiales bacterium]